MITQEIFISAAQDGNLEIIRSYLLQPGADIECRSYLNLTALLLSARNGHLDVVRCLVENGADIHNAWYPDAKSGTALEMAAENGHDGIVDLLIDAGSAVNNPITRQSPALVAAAMAGHLSIVNRLIDAGANAKSVTGDKSTILILISGLGPNHAKNQDPILLTECMQKILDAGVDINTVDNLHETALSLAFNANNDVSVKFLLGAGADPDLAVSLLSANQLVRYPKCLKLLIDAGMDTRCFVKAITTAALLEGRIDNALMLANALPEDLKSLHTRGIRFIEGCLTRDLKIFSDHVKAFTTTQIISLYGGIAVSVVMNRYWNQYERIQILLNAGAGVGTDLGYRSPIIKAAKNGNFELLKLLIDHGADPDGGAEDFGTPLMLVLGLDRQYDDRTRPGGSFDAPVDRMVNLLVDSGANVNALGPENNTALMIAIQMYPFNIEPLLQAGADVNTLSKFSWSPLMQANPKITRRLIEAGADVHLKNKDGRTALFLSTTPAKADALRKAGGDPAQKDSLGMTPLMYHASQNNMKMVKWFAKYKKNICAIDNKGNNALMYAFEKDCAEILSFLKACGENPSIVNYQGDTLLIQGCRMSNKDMIRLALESDIDINAVNAHGESALLIACRYHDDGETAKGLIRNGADPFIKAPDGKNAIEIARQFKPATAIAELERVIQ
ncbi:MAG: hypothetical protein C4518_01830 [Desulfobacteraceae bacterium]|nr:MAG: hypothetical protein C4518_01830 [Desulfobacteraceae bacterium]